MSVTHPEIGLASDQRRGFATRHPQLTPFLVAVSIAAVSTVVALVFIPLPA
jgi:hypothetical protein